MEVNKEERLELKRIVETGSPLEENIYLYNERDLFVIYGKGSRLGARDIAAAYFSRIDAEKAFQKTINQRKGYSYSILSGTFEEVNNGQFSQEALDSIDQLEIYGCLERYLLK